MPGLCQGCSVVIFPAVLPSKRSCQPSVISSGVSVLGSTLVHEENRANDMAQVDKKPVAVVLFITDSILELSF